MELLYATLVSLSLLLGQLKTAVAQKPPVLAPQIIESDNVPPPTQSSPTSENLAKNRPFKLLPPLFPKIAECESGNKQFYENGEVVRSHTKDIGLYQINEPIHYLKAKSMGLDIYKEPDNEAYAIYLWTQNGYRDWSASKKCWSK